MQIHLFSAVSKMDKVKLFEKIISVGMSKFPEIQIPIKNVSFLLFFMKKNEFNFNQN